MSKFFKNICGMLVTCITFIACSGCYTSGLDTNPHISKNITLGTSPANITYREMSEDLFIGYLGAQRDFALVVDNLDYNYENNIGSCKDDDTVGCASAMGQLILGNGIKETTINKKPSDKNVLIYYASSKNYAKWSGKNWADYVFPTITKSNSSMKEFTDEDNVASNLCGRSESKNNIACGYAKDMNVSGFSDVAGQSMILLFDGGNLASIITDNDIDPKHELDTGKTDNIIKSDPQHLLYKPYYNKLTKMLANNIEVFSSTVDSSAPAVKREIQQLDSISDLINLIEGKEEFKGIEDYLLLINTEGFISDKIGNNYYYSSIQDAQAEKNMINDNMSFGDSEDDRFSTQMMALFNSITVYQDNCAVENNELINLLKSVLSSLITGTLAAAGGAALGAALGSVIPGLGTVAGAIIGGILGFFAGIAAENAINKMLEDSNGITGDKYCKIMNSALKDIEINVPIYSYTIASFLDYKTGVNKNNQGNLHRYNNGTMDPALKKYYDANKYVCLTQAAKVATPSGGVISFFSDALDKQYNYADKCEIELVKNITGGFSGSPSLLLYGKGKQLDDLNGRLTPQVIREVVFSWGLSQIGSLYTLTTDRNINSIGSIVGSAQEITSLTYCVGDSNQPDCTGKTMYDIEFNKDNSYVSTNDVNNGIKFDFTNRYKEEANRKVKEDIDNAVYDNLILGPLETEKISKSESDIILYKYKHKINSESWKTETDDGTNLNNIKKDIITAIKTQGNWAKYKYSYHVTIDDTQKIVNNIYLIDGDNIIAYRVDDENNIIVEYCHIGNDSYIFNKDTIHQDIEISDNPIYITPERLTDPEITISSAIKDFYIYVKYVLKDGTEGTYTFTF